MDYSLRTDLSRYQSYSIRSGLAHHFLDLGKNWDILSVCLFGFGLDGRYFLVVAIAGAITGLADCLYNMLMDRKSKRISEE